MAIAKGRFPTRTFATRKQGHAAFPTSLWTGLIFSELLVICSFLTVESRGLVRARRYKLVWFSVCMASFVARWTRISDKPSARFIPLSAVHHGLVSSCLLFAVTPPLVMHGLGTVFSAFFEAFVCFVAHVHQRNYRGAKDAFVREYYC